MQINKRIRKFQRTEVDPEKIQRRNKPKQCGCTQNQKIVPDSSLLVVTHTISSIPCSPFAKREIINILFAFFQQQINAAGLAFACPNDSSDCVVEFGRGTWLNHTGLCFEQDGGAIHQVLQKRELMHGQLIPFDQDLALRPAGKDPTFSICLPVTVEKQLLGAFWIERMHPFSHGEVLLTKNICDIAAVSFYRLMILEDSQASIHRMFVINRLSQALKDMESLDNISAQLSKTVYELLSNVGEILISSIEQGTASIRYIYTGSKTHVLAADELPLMLLSHFDQELQHKVIASAKSIQISPVPEVTDMAILIGSPSRIAHSAVYIPMQSDGKVIGILQVHRSTINPFTAEEEVWLGILANIGAITIERYLMAHKMRQTETDLDQAYETMLDAWVRTLMLRDSETEEHTRRVCELTIKMARSIGYPEEELTNLRRGSLLHDIGKIGIPDAILHKPGSLTEDEWKIMRKHPVYAYHLISPITFPQSTIDIPYCHHEKWDGSGYPRGLRGEEIPLSARIFAVADVWDALTSYRPYRAAWTEEKAIEYIIEQSGQSFDPQVVNVFLHCQMDIDYDTLSTVCVLKTQSLPLLFQFPIAVQSKTNGFS